MKTKYIILAFIFAVLISDSFAQYQFTVRNFSLGKASTASSYGIDAIGFNPANIGKTRSIDSNNAEFGIATNIGFMMDATFAPIDMLDKYFTKNPDGSKKFLTTSDKNDIIDKMGDAPINTIGNLKPLSIVFKTNAGTFGFAIEERAGGYLFLDKDFLDVGLFGNEINRVYSFSDLNFNASYTRQISVSYTRDFALKSKNFKQISLGASIKPQFGFYYSEVLNNNLQIFTNDTNQIVGSGRMNLLYSGNSSDRKFEAPFKNAGFGFGFDVGMATTLENFFNIGRLNLGFSITDIGYINWTSNTNTYYYDGSFIITDITKKEQLDTLQKIIDGTKTPTGSFSRMLPTTIRLGAQYKYYSDKKVRDGKAHSEDMELMSFSLDYIQGLTENYGGTTNPIVAFGYEFNPVNALSGRLGIMAGGREKFEVSFGIGINAGAFSMDLGTFNILSVFAPRSTKNFSGGLNIKFRI